MGEIEHTEEVHSIEIQELMGEIPRWIIRWGLVVIFFILFVLLVGSFFFKSPEIISAPVVLTTINPPVPLVAKSTGKIGQIFIANEQLLVAGTRVAYISNPASLESYLELKHVLGDLKPIVGWEKKVVTIKLPEELSLGTIGSAYFSFSTKYHDFKHYLDQNLIPAKISLLRKQISKQKEYYSTLLKQRSVMGKDLGFSKKAFLRDSILFNRSTTSESEYEKSRQQWLGKVASSIAFDASLKNTESSILQMEQNIIELQMQHEKEITQYRLSLDEALLSLDNQVRQWEEVFMITSPVNGRITFTSVWSSNQDLKTGEPIGTIVPSDSMKIIARAIVPKVGIGKIEIGQKVNIKLSGFPYMEFGMLKGRIRSVSLVPEEKGYLAEIELISGMTSSYSERLKFIQQMDGTAEIVTKEYRLISRFIYPIRAILDKNL